MKGFLFLLLFSIGLTAQKTSELKVDAMSTGTLYTPEKPVNNYVVILVAGSGPTDRDGNQTGAVNNSLKFLAQELSKSGTAVFAYDKQTVVLARNGGGEESSFKFDSMIFDLSEIVSYFRSEQPYKKIIIAGHSEGSTIGMNAASGADAFISIAGPGESIDKVLTSQITKQAPMFKAELEKNFAELKAGRTFKNENQMLESIFRESLQPYLISWVKHDPAVEIAKLKIPVLIVNGDKDIQVDVAQAEILKKAKPDAQYAIITNMNHVLKNIQGDLSENYASYTNPDLPVSQALVSSVNQFLKTL